MPINIDEFESGHVPDEPSVPERIVAFLAAHDEQAFTRSEIAARIDADPNTIGTALSRLKARELVRHRGNHWAVTDDRQRLLSAYRLHAATESLNEGDGGIDPAERDEHTPNEPHLSERNPEA